MGLKRFVFSFVLILPLTGNAQQAPDTLVSQYANQISERELRENLTVLASDFMEGRETGKRGQRMAASFIRAHFSDNQLLAPVSGDFLQPLELYLLSQGDTYLEANQRRYTNFTDFAFLGMEDSGGEVATDLVFAGNGEESVYQQIDVRNKAVLLIIRSSGVINSKEVSMAREHGARMVFVCNTETVQEFERTVSQAKRYLGGHRLSLEKPEASEQQRPGVFVVSSGTAAALLGAPMSKLKTAIEKKSYKKIKAATIHYKTSVHVGTVATENVVGLVEGSDKKDEILLVTAHYDHVGVKQEGTGDVINNGADDDGSGTVAVMEMARVFAKARREGHGPRRSILFMLVTGEESGLLGSEFYAEHPLFSLQNTVADLNIDMIGRRDPQHKQSAPYLYVIGADKLSSELNEINERMNKTYTKLVFDYTYNDESHPDRLYYRSDHWNFAKRNVPIIFYFDGIHEDYHKVTDEVSKIEFPLLRQRAQCVFYTAWELANRDKRIVADKGSH
jgi:hypothetical protein